MDLGNGKLELFENDKKLNERLQEMVALREKIGSVFRVGEILEIKDSRFKIKSIGKREMRLYLLPKG